MIVFRDGAPGVMLAGNAPASGGSSSGDGYVNEQKLRAHERKVRAARRVLAASASPRARTTARRHLAGEEARLAQHVASTGVLRQPHRERIGVAR